MLFDNIIKNIINKQFNFENILNIVYLHVQFLLIQIADIRIQNIVKDLIIKKKSNAHNINEFIIEMIFTSQDYLAMGVITIVMMIMCVSMYDRCR